MDHNMIRHFPVAVIGAGPTGITAATLLAQYGVECLILDRWPTVYSQPRAVHMDDEVCRIVARLGIADQFAAISRPALGLRLLDNELNTLAEFHRDTDRSSQGFPQANMFDQPEFEALLRANLAHYPHAQLQGGLEVTDVADDPHGPVRISATDRSNARQHTITADYVLGCDGANSLVRRSIGTSMRDMKFEQRWLVVDVATTADLHQWEGVHQVCNPRRAGTYMRIGDTRYRWEFRLLPGESAEDFATLRTLRPLIAPWIAQVSDRDLTLVRAAEYNFRAQIADHWRRANIFLLGDAAHLTPPFVGQGMGAGLRDAMNLSWKLAGVFSHSFPVSILDTYEQERKPHTRHMIRLALAMGRAMTAGGEVGNLARRAIVPRLHLIPGLRAKVLNSETPALPESAMVHKSTGRLAGRLCPNADLGNGNRLDDELGTGFALITTTALTAPDAAHIEQRGARVHVAKPDGALADWLHHGHASAAILRPDRTVLRAGSDLKALCDALPAFYTPEARASSGLDQPPSDTLS
jgi:3-(3-hydroxy-phenyl)propionate hydroxylase